MSVWWSVPSSIQLTSSCETKSSELSEYRNLMKLTCNSWLNFELFLMGWGLGFVLNDVNRAQKSVTIFTINYLYCYGYYHHYDYHYKYYPPEV